MKLKDQVAIVTGAGRNIGEEIAKLFAAEGAKVAVVDLDRPRGERTRRRDQGRGRRCRAVRRRRLQGQPTSRRWSRRWSAASAASTSWSTTSRSPTTSSIFDITEEEWDRVHGGDAQEPVPDGASTWRSRWSRRAPAAGSSMSARPRAGMGAAARQSPIRPPRAAIANFTRAHGGAACAAQHPRQRDRAEQDRLAGRQGRVRSDAAGAEHGSSAPASRRKPRRRCCSWRARIRRSSIGENLFVDGGVSAMDLS